MWKHKRVENNVQKCKGTAYTEAVPQAHYCQDLKWEYFQAVSFQLDIAETKHEILNKQTTVLYLTLNYRLSSASPDLLFVSDL